MVRIGGLEQPNVLIEIFKMQILEYPKLNLQVYNVAPRAAIEPYFLDMINGSRVENPLFSPPIPQVDSPGTLQQGFYAVVDQKVVGYIMYFPAAKNIQDLDFHPDTEYNVQKQVLEILIYLVVSGEAWIDAQMRNEIQFYTYTGPVWRDRAIALCGAFEAVNYQTRVLSEDGDPAEFDAEQIPERITLGVPLVFVGKRFYLVE